MENLIGVRHGVVIVAGGVGKRYGSTVPKQFLLLNSKPVLMHTIDRFAHLSFKLDVVVVLPVEHQDTWKTLCSEYNFTTAHTIADGGSERFYSVQNGIKLLTHCEIIGVHDGVRPIVSPTLIKNCFSMAASSGACVPAIRVNDSLRKGDFLRNHPISRADLYRVQTPQVFRQNWLAKAYEQPFNNEFTDDASVVEKAGFNIILTEGDEKNIKITNETDLSLAGFYLKNA